jgi:hypothetical protein
MQSKQVNIRVRFRSLTPAERFRVARSLQREGGPTNPSDQDLAEYMATAYIASGQTVFSQFEDGFSMEVTD